MTEQAPTPSTVELLRNPNTPRVLTAPRPGFRDSGSWASAGLLALMIAVAGLTVARTPFSPRWPEARFRPLLEQALRARSSEVVVGAFDAGFIGYLATSEPRLTVVNLDGLVNNEAFNAAREVRYVDYVIQRVDFLLQHPRRARIFVSDREIARLRAHYRNSVESP